MADPTGFQHDEDQFRRSLARFSWMQPLLTFVGMLSLGLLIYIFSQTAEIDSQFPSGFLLGLAGGFLSTAVIFYFYEYAFSQRMEKRAYYARLSGTRRRTGVLLARKQALTERQNGLLNQVTALSPGGIAAAVPHTRAQALEMLMLAHGLEGTLIEWDVLDEELAAALRENTQIQAEDAEQAQLEQALDSLIAFSIQRQQRTGMHTDLAVEIRRLNALLPTLPETIA
ncbi:MAG TPA: hypothetical protein VER79_10210 [Candidatus Limnocylindrales bacterium]|nr:hypothetical protein [Candidatus Limnocylindrales bacterium]